MLTHEIYIRTRYKYRSLYTFTGLYIQKHLEVFDNFLFITDNNIEITYCCFDSIDFLYKSKNNGNFNKNILFENIQMFALPAYNKKSASVPINNYNASITYPIYFFVHYIQSYQIRIKATAGGNSLSFNYDHIMLLISLTVLTFVLLICEYLSKQNCLIFLHVLSQGTILIKLCIIPSSVHR